MAEHTPTPWKAETIYSYTNGQPVEISIQSHEEEIAMIDLEGEDETICRANAELIVLAVNSRSALMDALQDIIKNSREKFAVERAVEGMRAAGTAQAQKMPRPIPCPHCGAKPGKEHTAACPISTFPTECADG